MVAAQRPRPLLWTRTTISWARALRDLPILYEWALQRLRLQSERLSIGQVARPVCESPISLPFTLVSLEHGARSCAPAWKTRCVTSAFVRLRSEERRVGKECRSRWSP